MKALTPVPPVPTPQSPAATPLRPTAAPARGPIAGRVRRADETGDVTHSNGRKPPTPKPSIDLTSVQLDADGGMLRVTFETVGPVLRRLPTKPRGPDDAGIWGVWTWLGEDPIYRLEARVLGSEWSVSIYDLKTNREENLPIAPTIQGNRLTVAYSVGRLPKLSAPFTWAAYVEWEAFEAGPLGDVWIDWVSHPGGDADDPTDDPRQRAKFPE